MTENKILEILKKDKENKSSILQKLNESEEIDSKNLTKILKELNDKGLIEVSQGKWKLTTHKICENCEGKGWVDQK